MDTIAVHGGLRAYEHHPVVPPIYQVSTFAFEDAAHGAALFAGDGRGYIYSRMGLPVTIVRYFNSYGPRLDPSGYGSVVANFHNTADWMKMTV